MHALKHTSTIRQNHSWKTPNMTSFHHQFLLRILEIIGFQFAHALQGTVAQNYQGSHRESSITSASRNIAKGVCSSVSSWVKGATWFCWSHVRSSRGQEVFSSVHHLARKMKKLFSRNSAKSDKAFNSGQSGVVISLAWQAQFGFRLCQTLGTATSGEKNESNFLKGRWLSFHFCFYIYRLIYFQ